LISIKPDVVDSIPGIKPGSTQSLIGIKP
jgi:hypothetical protein